jgi:hypothetical protein
VFEEDRTATGGVGGHELIDGLRGCGAFESEDREVADSG